MPFICAFAGEVIRANFPEFINLTGELVPTEAGNSVLTAGVFHGLVRNFGFCTCNVYFV